MSLVTAPTFVFAPGDTWVMPVTYQIAIAALQAAVAPATTTPAS